MRCIDAISDEKAEERIEHYVLDRMSDSDELDFMDHLDKCEYCRQSVLIESEIAKTIRLKDTYEKLLNADEENDLEKVKEYLELMELLGQDEENFPIQHLIKKVYYSKESYELLDKQRNSLLEDDEIGVQWQRAAYNVNLRKIMDLVDESDVVGKDALRDMLNNDPKLRIKFIETLYNELKAANEAKDWEKVIELADEMRTIGYDEELEKIYPIKQYVQDAYKRIQIEMMLKKSIKKGMKKAIKAISVDVFRKAFGLDDMGSPLPSESPVDKDKK